MTTVTPHSEEFAMFYRSTVERTFRTAYRAAGGDRHTAWDATQESYEELLHEWNNRELRTTEHNERYVARVAVRRVADSSPKGTVPDDEQEIPDGPLPAAARALIDRQPAESRAVAVLFFLLECGLAEIAVILGIPESTTRTHVERMRVLMKPLIDGGEA
jgi:DNA-directed RNA polymerase specialized sigma24 family protein